MEYRNLTKLEIEQLEGQGCRSHDWQKIQVKKGFVVINLINVRIEGDTTIGILKDDFYDSDGLLRSSGIFNSSITNCKIKDNVVISNVGILLNYIVDQHTIIENTHKLMVTEESSFGIGTQISILNEAGGRELPLSSVMSSQIAHLIVHHRHDDLLQNKLFQMGESEKDNSKCDVGKIGKNVFISNVKEIRNVKINDGAVIRNSSSLYNGTINSCTSSPSYIGTDVIAKDFVTMRGSSIDSSVVIDNCLVGEATKLGKQYSAENSAFFANCEAYHGEACSIFAGPYTVTHHKSSLLIAGNFSFYNAGSGSNQSNHMYKLGPVHQGIVERGSKTGSFSYLLFPSKIGPFSVVLGKHYKNFDASDFPFSYINEEEGKSVLTPALNLFSVGTKRDSEKWMNRDKRNFDNKLDIINFDIYSPFIVDRIIKAASILQNLYKNTPREVDYVSYKGLHMPRLLMKTCRKYYELGINISIGEQIKSNTDIEDIQHLDKLIVELNDVDNHTHNDKWFDVGGQYISEQDFKLLKSNIISGKIKSFSELNNEFASINEAYKLRVWNWFKSLIKEKFAEDGVISKAIIYKIMENYFNSKMKLLNMILKDAEKEFDENSKIGYGLDCDSAQKESDFVNVRGSFETNNFVVQVKKETNEIELEFNRFKLLLNLE